MGDRRTILIWIILTVGGFFALDYYQREQSGEGFVEKFSQRVELFHLNQHKQKPKRLPREEYYVDLSFLFMQLKEDIQQIETEEGRRDTRRRKMIGVLTTLNQDVLEELHQLSAGVDASAGRLNEAYARIDQLNDLWDEALHTEDPRTREILIGQAQEHFVQFVNEAGVSTETDRDRLNYLLRDIKVIANRESIWSNFCPESLPIEKCLTAKLNEWEQEIITVSQKNLEQNKKDVEVCLDLAETVRHEIHVLMSNVETTEKQLEEREQTLFAALDELTEQTTDITDADILEKLQLFTKVYREEKQFVANLFKNQKWFYEKYRKAYEALALPTSHLDDSSNRDVTLLKEKQEAVRESLNDLFKEHADNEAQWRETIKEKNAAIRQFLLNTADLVNIDLDEKVREKGGQ